MTEETTSLGSFRGGPSAPKSDARQSRGARGAGVGSAGVLTDRARTGVRACRPGPPGHRLGCSRSRGSRPARRPSRRSSTAPRRDVPPRVGRCSVANQLRRSAPVHACASRVRDLANADRPPPDNEPGHRWVRRHPPLDRGPHDHVPVTVLLVSGNADSSSLIRQAASFSPSSRSDMSQILWPSCSPSRREYSSCSAGAPPRCWNPSGP